MRILIPLNMRLTGLILFFNSVIFLPCCQAQTALPEKGKVTDNLRVSTDTSLTYTLYIPYSVTALDSAPVILFFDPQGNGRVPVDKYLHLAEKYQVVLAGNNNSRNGQELTSIYSNLLNLLQELQKKFGVSEDQLCFWGFSGGAKAAMFCGDQLPEIRRIIYGGAFLPMDHSKKTMGFNGTQDMNYSDLLGYAISQQNNPDYLQVEFDGKHDWPDTITATDAFTWLKLERSEVNSLFVLEQAQTYRYQFEVQLRNKNILRAGNELEKAVFLLRGKTDIVPFAQQLDSLKQSEVYREAMKARLAIQEQEQQLKKYYSQQFFSQTIGWWETEIQKLNASKNPMHQRIVAFFSLAAYSLSHETLQLNDLAAAQQILTIYQLSDPANPEQAFLRSVLYARQKNKPHSQAALDEAKKLGFINTARVRNDPYLSKLGIK